MVKQVSGSIGSSGSFENKTKSQALQQALDSWPHWSATLSSQPVIEKTLNSGLSHNTYQLSSGSQHFALRVENTDSRELAMGKTQEVNLMTAAQRLAPTVIWTDDNTLVTEFINGQPWQPPQNLDLFCQSLRELHRKTVPLPQFDLLEHCDQYWEKIHNSPECITTVSSDVFTQCRALLINILATYPEQTLCHNDLNPDNILCRGDEFIFLDWEYACYNSPYFELATVAEFFNLTDTQTSQLSATYWQNHQPLQHQQALQSFRIVVRFIEWLWLILKQSDLLTDSEQRLQKLLKNFGK